MGTLLAASPLVLVLTSVATAALIFPMGEQRVRLRTAVNLTGAVLKLALVLAVVPVVLAGARPTVATPLLPGVELVLRIDELSLLFMTLSALLWLVTTVYAIGYLEGSPHRSRFFGYFSLCVASTFGIALAGNLVTLLIFYELLTLATYPLVAHRGTADALAGARTYLRYTLVGGAVLLTGVAGLTAVAGDVRFTPGGAAQLADLAASDPWLARTLIALLIGGFAVKAALVPVHGWLPRAMVAPAPVSALLHAVAVVKAGAFGIVRVVYDVVGIEVADVLGVMQPLAVLAAVTVVYGSLRALTQDSLKKRLAYSTVSQVSYIVLGVSTVGVLSTTGATVHLVHQGLMKITLFFCAGAFAELLGVHKVSELRGVARRMPVTGIAFTIGALGMIGAPPVAGYVTKWYLGAGALAAGQGWVVAVLVVSTLLNAAYFLPPVMKMWQRPEDEPEVEPGADPLVERPAVPVLPHHQPLTGVLVRVMLVGPLVVTATLSLLTGVLADAAVGPLALAERIARSEYP